jgi:hypothetical protein
MEPKALCVLGKASTAEYIPSPGLPSFSDHFLLEFQEVISALRVLNMFKPHINCLAGNWFVHKTNQCWATL